MARIFVVEDDASVRKQLCTLLKNAGHTPVLPTNLETIVRDICAASPDIVLLDLGLPGTDGQYVLRELRQKSNVPAMVLTSRTSELDELMSMSLGADDFLAKPYNGQILLAHIDAIMRRTQSADANSRTLSFAGITLDLSRSFVSLGEKSVELTKNELRILETLLQGKGAIVPREDIMEALWNSDEFVDDNTLTVNMNRLRRTLAKIGADEVIITHRGQGYSILARS
ncbi:response regulator transcription factor [Atopobium fossor]|uniref:response regulator transcription factor n=1 Tax=Atopobium fossor TaxID=39487 RepID=UPI0004299917|nr:response regulator transcription factor [Atopobium fossor]